MDPNLFDWFLIFNLYDFEAANIPSRTYTVELKGKGLKDILVTKGNLLSMTYEGVMVSLDMNGANPFLFEGVGIYRKVETGDIFLGVLK